MTVGKHLRYHILQRDRFTCRYCGASAPDAVLVVDHVTPRSRGGADIPGNLVAACQDCNSGKSDVMPDAWLVEEIERTAAEWEQLPGLDEDDLYEMEVYQDSLRDLAALASEELLHCIARAYAAAPYRPTHSELIRCAGFFARQTCLPTVGTLCRGSALTTHSILTRKS